LRGLAGRSGRIILQLISFCWSIPWNFRSQFLFPILILSSILIRRHRHRKNFNSSVCADPRDRRRHRNYTDHTFASEEREKL